jgi:hypothetical protein
MSDMTDKFDWHQQGENSFRKWLIPSLCSGDEIDLLSEATDRFTNIEIAIQINGVEIDASGWIDRLEEAFDREVPRHARKMIEDVPRLTELYDAVQDLEREVRRKIFELAREAGIDPSENDW